MNLGDYLLMLVKAYNPNQYGKLMERPAREFLIFLGLTLLLALIIFTAIIVPFTLNYIQSIPERTASIDHLKLKAEVNATEMVVLMEQPKITLDMDGNVTRSGDITFTDEGILYPKYLFFGTAETPWSELRDLKQQTPERDKFLASIIIFLLPSIIFWMFTFGLIACAIIFLLLVALGWLAPKMLKHRLSFAESWKMAVIAMPSMLVFSLALYPLGAATLVWGGIILTVVLFTVGVAVLSEIDAGEDKFGKHKRA